MKNVFFFLTIIVLILFSSCKSREDPDTSCVFEEGVAQGTLLNNSWTFREGTAESSTGEYQIFLYETNEIASADLCAEDASNLTATHITFFVENIVGTQTFQQATIYNATTADIATVSATCLEVDEISASAVKGRIAFTANGNTIDGSFTATICN